MDPTKLTVAQLKAELVSLELPTTGLKAVLLERLQSALAKPAEASPVVVDAEEAKSATEPAISAKRVLEDALPGGTAAQAPAKKAFRPTRPASLPTPPVVSPPIPTPDVVIPTPQETPAESIEVAQGISEETMQMDKQDATKVISTPVEPAPITSESTTKMEVDTPATKVESAESAPSASTSKLPSDAPPPSESLYIGSLVRPFTIPQLREMLNEYGDFVSSSFWIDAIKTHCYLTYSTLASAVAAHDALSNNSWPSANTQSLSVFFVPTSQLPLLVAEEEQAKQSRNRVRLELHCSRSESEGRIGEWDFNLRPFQPARDGPAGVRGLASAVPTGDRVSMPEPRRPLPAPYSAPVQPVRLASNPYVNQLPRLAHLDPPTNAPTGPKGPPRTIVPQVASPTNFNSTATMPKLYWCEQKGGKGISTDLASVEMVDA